jgi:hypothetical protein
MYLLAKNLDSKPTCKLESSICCILSLSRMIYSTPGVYVEEQPSTSQPIIGVGTTIPVFLSFYRKHQQKIIEIEIDPRDTNEIKLDLEGHPVINCLNDEGVVTFNYKKLGEHEIDNVKLSIDNSNKKSYCTIKTKPIKAPGNTQDKIQDKTTIQLIYLSFAETSENYDFVKCNNFKDFELNFGNFTIHPEKSCLAHAVLGFFQNGGTRCYVCRADNITQTPGVTKNNVDDILKFSENHEDISLIIPVGREIKINERTKIIEHCGKMKDRFAIFHYNTQDQDIEKETLLDKSEHRGKAAVYHPWVKVFDPATNKDIDVPPSGHVAGIYARVDDQQGVQKCPANEVVVGVKDVSIAITKEEQDILNPKGINCIRVINGKIKVWGARTLDIESPNSKYINVSRSFMFLSESIEKGTQWAVFQPNTIALRQQIVRNITDFLLIQWRAGMLFGETQQEAFIVQCDAETNRNADQGVLRAIVQVALVQPAEFIIIQISHKQAS